MGMNQTKLHWSILAEDWKACLERLGRNKGKLESRTLNPCGDLPLHLCCYGGQAPPHIIHALIDANPESLRVKNNKGRDPMTLAAINYRIGSPHRREVLAALRWRRPGNSPTSQNDVHVLDSTYDDEMFSSGPPAQMYSTSVQCIICADNQATVALIPCGHVCLCLKCVQTTIMQQGICPVDRCEVTGLYRLQGEEITIHNSMCNDDNTSHVAQSKENIGSVGRELCA